MVKLISEAILDNYDYCVESGWSVDADSVLGALEQAGMLPPYKNNESIPSMVFGNQLVKEQVEKYHCLWELEDE